MITKERVLQALSSVKDADGDIVSRGLVKNVNIYTDGVEVILSLRDMAPESIRDVSRRVEESVGGVEGAGKVKVVVSPMVGAPPVGASASRISTVIAVASGKGGVGKSTVAVNLAVSLARMGHRVGLLDADIYGASAHLMLGKDAAPTADNNRIQPATVQGVKLVSMGFFSRSDTPVIWRGPLVGKAVKDFVDMTDWGELDYLVVDLPPGTGDAPLTLAQSLKLSGVVLVTTPQEAAVQVAMKAHYMFKRLGIPVVGVIENMSHFVCQHCGKTTEIFGKGGGRRVAERLGIPFIGELPVLPALSAAGDTGVPLDPAEDRSAAIFDEVAETVARLVRER
ncbi:MAG: Mrp/NBP35 family ATP-binding protein [Nitrososphaerota archaeon]|nr:Mrp/NBP35 family ATP-binding protein [Nitrososphaerota archaeon]